MDQVNNILTNTTQIDRLKGHEAPNNREADERKQFWDNLSEVSEGRTTVAVAEEEGALQGGGAMAAAVAAAAVVAPVCPPPVPSTPPLRATRLLLRARRCSAATRTRTACVGRGSCPLASSSGTPRH